MVNLNDTVQNRYLVGNLIGRGGMGAVYLAEDTRFSNRKVALKEMLFTDNPKLEAAFAREANLLAQLSHRGLPKVSDYFNERGFQYLVMEYIPGDDLETLQKNARSPFPYKRVLNWADSLLEILEYLHSHQPPVLHRDIKPQNLKLTHDDKVFLLDFGLAKDSLMQSANSLVGFTPNYAPLEQLEGSYASVQTDLYLFSATIYHLLTGTLPASSLNRIQAQIGNRSDPLAPAHELNPEVPQVFSAFLAHGLNLQREQRPASAAEMRQRLREIVRESAVSSESATAKINLPNRTDDQRNVQTAVFSTPPAYAASAYAPPADTERMPQVNQTMPSIPLPTPVTAQFSAEPTFTPAHFQNPQNSQPILTAPTAKKSRRGVLLPVLVGLLVLLGVGGAGAYFMTQKFLARPETPAKPADEKVVTDGEKVSGSASSSANPSSSNSKSAENDDPTGTVQRDNEKSADKRNAGQKVVQQQPPPQQQQPKTIQKPTVQVQKQPSVVAVKPSKPAPKPSGGSEIDQ